MNHPEKASVVTALVVLVVALALPSAGSAEEINDAIETRIMNQSVGEFFKGGLGSFDVAYICGLRCRRNSVRAGSVPRADATNDLCCMLSSGDESILFSGWTCPMLSIVPWAINASVWGGMGGVGFRRFPLANSGIYVAAGRSGAGGFGVRAADESILRTTLSNDPEKRDKCKRHPDHNYKRGEVPEADFDRVISKYSDGDAHVEFAASCTTNLGGNSTCFYYLGVAAEEFADPYFPDLNYCIDDVDAISGLCKRISKDRNSEYVPIILNGETLRRDEVVSAFDELISVATSEDTVVMAFATHGVRLQRGLYLVLPTSRPGSMQGTGVEWQLVAKCVTKVKAQRVVVLLDACHAGSFADSNLEILNETKKDLASRKGLMVISATDAHNPAFELTEDFSHGAFTQALLDVIPGTKFPWVESADFFPSLKSRVQRLTDENQVPVLTLDVPLDE